MEQPELDVSVDASAFPNPRRNSKGGLSAIDVSGDIKLDETAGRFYWCFRLNRPQLVCLGKKI